MNTQLQGLANAFVTQIIQPLVDLIFVVGVLVFVWGVVEFLLSLSGGGENTNDGKKHMLWGIVGVFVMAGVLGILQLLTTAICGGSISACYAR
jgi:Type IV secretion system pilin